MLQVLSAANAAETTHDLATESQLTASGRNVSEVAAAGVGQEDASQVKYAGLLRAAVCRECIELLRVDAVGAVGTGAKQRASKVPAENAPMLRRQQNRPKPKRRSARGDGPALVLPCLRALSLVG